MKISYYGEYLGFPKEEFNVRIPSLKGIKEIKLFGTYGDDLVITKGWKTQIAKNVINGNICEVETDEHEHTIALGLPFEFREKSIKEDKERLAKALRCLFKEDR